MFLIGLLAIAVAIVIFLLALASGVMWGRQKGSESQARDPRADDV